MSETHEKPRTVGEILKWAVRDFEKHGIDSARIDAEILLADALGIERVEVYLRFDDLPAEASLAAFREAVKRRRNREPVAHITGKKGFHEIELRLRPGMFVPRPETEELVDEAAARLRKTERPRLADLCSGTGAVALALLHCVPGLSATCVDVDPVAGEVLAENARALGVADRVEFIEADLFAGLAGREPFRVISCNPPYVLTGQIEGLEPEVRDHEPRRALDGGEQGLDVIERLIEGAAEFLEPGGWLIIEVGEDEAAAAAAMAPAELEHEATRSDLAGIPRVVIFRKK